MSSIHAMPESVGGLTRLRVQDIRDRLFVYNHHQYILRFGLESIYYIYSNRIRILFYSSSSHVSELSNPIKTPNLPNS